MILTDTSIWVDHLRRGEAQLTGLLERNEVVMHPFVVGEIACGNLADRSSILGLLQDLPMAVIAETDEVLSYIDSHGLHDRGIGYVDAHLLVSVALAGGTRLWTRDKRLHSVAGHVGCVYLDADPS